MDLNVIATFKSNYFKLTSEQAMPVILPISLGEFREKLKMLFKILINAAWQRMTRSNMRSVYKTRLPYCANDLVGFTSSQRILTIAEEIVTLGNGLALKEVESENINELLVSHRDELNDGDLRRMRELTNAIDDDEKKHAVRN